MVQFHLNVHGTSELERELSGVSNIEVPDIPVYSIQKQRSGVFPEKVSGLL